MPEQVAACDFPDLSRLLSPRSVAILGASERPRSVGSDALLNLARHSDFDGDIFPVNPGRETVHGLRAYPAMSALPGPVDVAVVCLPAEAVLDALRDCAAAQTAIAVVFTSGFAETGDAGRAAEAEMAKIAQQSGMRIYGPNSPGLSNINRRLGLTFSPVFKNDTLGGGIGLITQGGGLGRSFIQASERGIGVGQWCSTGNEADLTMADVMHHMVKDPDIKVIALLAEGFRDGPRFLAAARAAAHAGKPVVAMKVGKSDYGVAATRSHTAALAGSAPVTSALMRQHGIVEVDDLDELIDTAALFERAGIARRGGICVYSFSGGTAALAADMVGSVGLTLSELAVDTRAGLRALAPSYAAVENPVDLTTQVFTQDTLNLDCLSLVARDPATDVVLVPIPADYGPITDRSADDMVALAPGCPALLVPVWMSGYRAAGYDTLNAAGLAPFRSLGKAVTALKRLIWRGGWSPADMNAPSLPALPPGELDEAAAKAALADLGLSVPEGRVVTSAQTANDAARGIGFPVVLKALVPGLLHKTEAGAVAVGLTDSKALMAAWDAMTTALAAQGQKLDRALIERMEQGPGIEVMAGLHRDPVFGPVVSFGLGGVMVEALEDVTHRAAPFGRTEALAMIDEIRGRALLGPLRGRPGADLDALADLLVTVAALGARGEIEELDLNPVCAGPEGAIVLDAMILRTATDTQGKARQ
ncbi:MAG: acetate--CoA ligase family protein [Sulfitobacter sp.]